ncbi:MAG: hypothetical protein ABIP94_12420 [Planctomycetota bacterium]
MLPRARTLAGTFTTLDAAPIEWANVWLEDEATHLQHSSKIGPDGAIAFGKTVQGASVFVVGVGDLADRCLDGWRAQLQASERGEEDVGAADPSVSVGWGFSDANGSFVLRAVPPGVPVRLVARQKGRELAVLPARVFQVGERIEAVRLQFSAR